MEVYKFKMDKKFIWIMNLIGLAVVFILMKLFTIFLIYFQDGKYANCLLHSNIFVTILVMLAVIVAHELYHGIAMSWYGGVVTYGVKLPLYAYAMETSGILFPARQMVIIYLNPVIGLTITLLLMILMCPQAIFYLGIGIILNVSGATADVYCAWLIHKKFKDCDICDDPEGFKVYKGF